MELYSISFAILALISIALAYYRHNADSKTTVSKESLSLSSGDGKVAAHKFKKEYFSVYALVVASDWLQGPYMYTLYKDEKALPEPTVAALFTSGFIVAGISASFVGALADKYGRRAGCLTFCITYALSCISVLSDSTLILFVGRALAGVSTTLLFAVFETWMVAEYHKRELSDCLSLGSMFSLSVTLSGIVAIVAGVVGEVIVGWTGTKTSPFMASAVCLVAAFAGMYYTWPENYGETPSDERKSEPQKDLRHILRDPRLLSLGFTTTIFEGSMYLFVYFWSPAIISSRALANDSSPPAFGLIFSCFMCAMMLGSLTFASIKPESATDSARLMLTILALASYGMLIPILLRSEAMTFWSFALFEVCVGFYFPTMSRLKSDLVDDAVRGKVYGLMRLPLNVFVVAALGLTREGDAYRTAVFTATGAPLLSAFLVVQRYLVG